MPDRWLPEFEWDENNEDKLLARHDVTAAEAEECFANPNTRRRAGTDLLLLGVTDGGRMLFSSMSRRAAASSGCTRLAT